MTVHALTVDVEDYYSVVAFDRLGITHEPSPAVVTNTHRIMEMLADAHVRGTFFILGEVARQYPSLVKDLSAAGHELGIHGFFHRQVFRLTPAEFAQSVRDAKALVEDLSGQSVRGHRAPAFSIGPETRWAMDALAESGFLYDSSVFPFAGRRYGWPGHALGITRVTLANGRSLIEAPLTVTRVLGRPMPACGGGYLRHFPGALTRWSIRSVQEHRPAIVYLHPCEIDSVPGPDWFESPMAKAPWKVRLFHGLQRRNRDSVEPKLRRLLREFRFQTLWATIEESLGDSTSAPPMGGKG